MKKFLLMIMAVMAFTLSTAAEEAVPAITFETMTHDFGDIPENGGPVTAYFEFTNTGTAPVVIVSAVASCGCTTPDYPRQPVQPGEKGVIKATYSPAGRPGEFTKSVKLKTNVPGAKKLTLKITGVVIPGR